MRQLVFVWLILLFPLTGAELEVRLYQIGEAELLGLHRLLVPEEEVRDDNQGDWIGKPLPDPGFESRFLEKGKDWVDCSRLIKEVLLVREFDGKALVLPEKDVVVMKVGNWEHQSFAAIVMQHRKRKIQMKAELYEVPDVKLDNRPIGFERKPVGAELLGEISVTAFPGQQAQARSEDGSMHLEVQPYIDANVRILEARLTLAGTLKGTKFRLKILPIGVFGMSWVHELGSLDGKTSVLAVRTPELILENGQREDAWILKEKGGEFLKERRLEELERLSVNKPGAEFRELLVRPAFFEGLQKAEEEGADSTALAIFRAKKAELAGVVLVYDAKALFEQNGISLREGNFIVVSKVQNRIYAKLVVEEHERLERLIKVRNEDFAPLIRIDLTQLRCNRAAVMIFGGPVVVSGERAGKTRCRYRC